SVRFNQIPSNAGLGLEMKVIAAAVVGGTAIRGGEGSLTGTLLRVVLLGAIGPALTFLGVSAYWERALQGAIILAAVAVDAVRERRGGHSAVADAGGCCSLLSHGGRRLMPFVTRRSLSSGEWILLLALAAEIVLFSAIAQNFFTRENFFEIL